MRGERLLPADEFLDRNGGLTCERVSAPPATAHGAIQPPQRTQDFLPQLSITGLLKRLSVEACCRSHRWCDVFARAARGRYLRQQPRNAPDIPEGSTLPDRGEGIMTMSEYEERFRSSTLQSLRGRRPPRHFHTRCTGAQRHSRRRQPAADESHLQPKESSCVSRSTSAPPDLPRSGPPAG